MSQPVTPINEEKSQSITVPGLYFGQYDGKDAIAFIDMSPVLSNLFMTEHMVILR